MEKMLSIRLCFVFTLILSFEEDMYVNMLLLFVIVIFNLQLLFLMNNHVSFSIFIFCSWFVISSTCILFMNFFLAYLIFTIFKDFIAFFFYFLGKCIVSCFYYFSVYYDMDVVWF